MTHCTTTTTTTAHFSLLTTHHSLPATCYCFPILLLLDQMDKPKSASLVDEAERRSNLPGTTCCETGAFVFEHEFVSEHFPHLHLSAEGSEVGS